MKRMILSTTRYVPSSSTVCTIFAVNFTHVITLLRTDDIESTRRIMAVGSLGKIRSTCLGQLWRQRWYMGPNLQLICRQAPGNKCHRRKRSYPYILHSSRFLLTFVIRYINPKPRFSRARSLSTVVSFALYFAFTEVSTMLLRQRAFPCIATT